MRRILTVLLLAATALMPLVANAVEIEDAGSDLWAVFISDQEVAEPSVEDLIASGVAIDSADSTITMFPTYEEGLIHLSSSLAEKMIAQLYAWGPESFSGVYQYNGDEGKFAMFAFAKPDLVPSLSALADYFMGNVEYSAVEMSLEEMMQE
ncbi:MAG: hypothetical protein IAA97_01320 [Spirochaetes bacterium]|uniref:DUF4252 domain-containing protein n=1 Tax=Candidatus Ornithospirochaeta stercoripullorum TaxID=2840899 RepID=A0A9D9H562_9SPIO|nr:hypothetical protein [Candidatus Ornithospirochaeta stercoripullorum]